MNWIYIIGTEKLRLYKCNIADIS